MPRWASELSTRTELVLQCEEWIKVELLGTNHFKASCHTHTHTYIWIHITVQFHYTIMQYNMIQVKIFRISFYGNYKRKATMQGSTQTWKANKVPNCCSGQMELQKASWNTTSHNQTTHSHIYRILHGNKLSFELCKLWYFLSVAYSRYLLLFGKTSIF